MRRLVFLGFALPEDEFVHLTAADKIMPTATQMFGWAVIASLMAAGYEVTAISAAPVTDYPHNPKMFFGRHHYTREGGPDIWTLPFVNVLGIKHVTRFLTASWALAKLTKRGFIAAIVVHGAHSPFLWAAVHAGARLEVPVVVLLTDPPSIATHVDTRTSLVLKRLDETLIRRALGQASGVVCVTAGLAEDYAPGRPWLLMEGIAPPMPNVASEVERGQRSKDSAIVLYAGGLYESYGVKLLLDAVSLSVGSWELHIFGGGPMEAECRLAASAEPRVHFHEVVDSQTLSKKYSQARILVNPRPLSGVMVPYSFPSKLLEYMATGTPVVTTHLPTIPKDYDPFLIYVQDDAHSLAMTLDGSLREPSELEELGSSAREFILKTRSSASQGERLRHFIGKLNPLFAVKGEAGSDSPASSRDEAM